MLCVLVVVFCLNHIAGLGLELGLARDTARSFFAHSDGPSSQGGPHSKSTALGGWKMASPIWGGAYLSLFLGHFCMAHSSVTAGEVCSMDRMGSERAEFTPLLVSDLHYSRWKTVSEKAPTIVGAYRFTRRGGTCRLHAIFMNQSSINWRRRKNCQASPR